MKIYSNSNIQDVINSCVAKVKQNNKITLPSEFNSMPLEDIFQTQSRNIKKPGILETIIQPLRQILK